MVGGVTVGHLASHRLCAGQCLGAHILVTVYHGCRLRDGEFAGIVAPVYTSENAGGFAPVRRRISLSPPFLCRDEDDRVVLQDDVSLWGVVRASLVRNLRRHGRPRGYLHDAGFAVLAFTHGPPIGVLGTAQPLRGCGSRENGQRDEGDGDGPIRGSRGTRRRAIVDPTRAWGHDRWIRSMAGMRVACAESDRRRRRCVCSKGRAPRNFWFDRDPHSPFSLH